MKNLFTKIAAFQYTYEANMVKAKLESNGLKVFLADGVTIDSDPLISNAIGGVKVFVLSEDAEQANGILQEMKQFSGNNSFHQSWCPNCNQKIIELYNPIDSTKALFMFVLKSIARFVNTIQQMQFPDKQAQKCENCNYKFDKT